MVAGGYGGPEVLALQDIVLPPPEPRQVLIDVRAAGANPIDYKLYSDCLGNDPDALPLPVGMEVAGVVAAVPKRTVICRPGTPAEKSYSSLNVAP